jgi:hypothetical protein
MLLRADRLQTSARAHASAPSLSTLSPFRLQTMDSADDQEPVASTSALPAPAPTALPERAEKIKRKSGKKGKVFVEEKVSTRARTWYGRTK